MLPGLRALAFALLSVGLAAGVARADAVEGDTPATAPPVRREAPAPAAEPAPSADAPAVSSDGSDGWVFSFSPYLWTIQLTGDVSARGSTVDVDTSFSDIVSKLNMGLMGAFSARRGPWLMMVDGMFAHLEDDDSFGPQNVGFGPATLTSGPITLAIPRVQTSVGPAEVESDTLMVIVKAVGGYRLLDRPLFAGNDARRLKLDLYAGGRYWYLDSEIKVKIPPVKVPGFRVPVTVSPPRFPGVNINVGDLNVPGVTLGGLDETFDATDWWIDPIVGARVRVDLTDRLGLRVWGDVGGFGIGSAADFTWEAMGLLTWQLSRSWSLLGGYRLSAWTARRATSGWTSSPTG